MGRGGRAEGGRAEGGRGPQLTLPACLPAPPSLQGEIRFIEHDAAARTVHVRFLSAEGATKAAEAVNAKGDAAKKAADSESPVATVLS